MDSEDLTASDPPTSIDPYEVLSIPRTASESEVKSAYRKLALTTHPDKAAPADREAAHTAFQSLAFAYAILSDPARRKRYDRTGSTAETLSVDDDDFNWADFFRAQYAEHVTVAKIRDLKNEYQGSEEEKNDVLKAYKAGKGNLDKVFEEVMLSSVLEDEERLRGYIDEAIESGEVDAYEKYTNESEKKKERRREKARKEAEEAEEAAEEMGVRDEVFGDAEDGAGKKKATKKAKSAGKKKKDTKGSEADLAALIAQRHAGRAAQASTFFDNLEAKYAGGSKGTKRKPEEPSEEAFAAMAKRSRKGKASKVIEEEEENEDEEEEVAPPRKTRPKRKGRA